ncbi:MAG: NADH pyrophosphatase [Ferrovum sp. 37-45-19]|uniref:NAD(+) diphosphatase n=1 Tax=Ferrovum sp. JA12 TaxID=1356299 RepID=UPI000702870D|nr:NAD(+) diphosphatase [Ferrovum sp. JA12]OYV79233.1 MAG: NADH pyrophosphatase [Ferrovum sp. 21-44-67]OYV93868.1 MAG: NADH pyrophosphatase [Ferrovum sp. 37-45-19]OZB32163.1 MAG: NADH pyrophosphatase [Ferrovum sp. 34-44-207]HQT82034.1 NAD(+) diphosphatase [Ferrovaceae bacterium]KRH78653.1 NADH pyrophosphatase [Ferrovum sp. JA12]
MANQLFFVFQGHQLLVTESETDPSLPDSQLLAECKPFMLRQHRVLDSQHLSCYALEVNESYIPAMGYRFIGLRSLFGLLNEELIALIGKGLQIIDWDRTHRYCPTCATENTHHEHELAKVCPNCHYRSYPRISPVVMGLIVRDQEILLARSPHFAPGMYSAIAGFCEVGESLEMALHREIKEEVNVVVDQVEYFTSQSWPFPHSLMVAFTCRYVSGTIVPQPQEIEDAKWFSIDALPLLPHPVSIARKLINQTVNTIKARHHALY